MALSRRNLRTLRAAARVIVPQGGTIAWAADDLDLAGHVAAEVATWPPRVRRQVRAFLVLFELLPLVTGQRRPFSALDPGAQARFLESTYRHRSASRRMLVTLLKQLCYSTYLCMPEVEEAVGYRYACMRGHRHA